MTISRRAILGGTTLVLATGTLRAASTTAGTDGFQLWEANKRVEHQQPILAYQGSVPGPTLRLKQGDELRVRLVNRLDQPTTLHWHGYQLPNAMDGAAGITQEAIAPGTSFDYRFTATDSGTYWYHPGIFGEQTKQIANGLFGVLIVEERSPPIVHEELVLTLHDPLDLQPAAEGRPQLSINGTAPPLAMTYAPRSRLRLRLINASSYRVAVIGFEGVKPMVVAIDGQPSDLFEPAHASLPLGPGARADLVADLPMDTPTAGRLIIRDESSDYDIVLFNLSGAAAAALPPIAPLAANPSLPTDINLAKAKRLDLVAEATTANFKLVAAPGSKSVEPDAVIGKPIFVAKRGTPVSLGFRNQTSSVQVVHLHGHAMRLLHPLDDGWEPYWRDSFLLPPQKTSRIAFVADKPGKWAIEAAPLEPAALVRHAFFEVT